jgi:formin 2
VRSIIITFCFLASQVLAAKSQALLDFHRDLVSLETASKVPDLFELSTKLNYCSKIMNRWSLCFLQIQLKSLAEEMQAIIKGLEKVKKELAASENDGPVSEVFRKVQSPLSRFYCPCEN